MKLTEHQNKVFKDRYQHGDETIEETFMRVAECSSKDEIVLGLDKKEQTKLFYEGLTRKHFTPAGRPIANIGEGYNNMLFNCFVIGIDDSRQGITSSLGDFMEIAALGGGIGANFGSLRPRGDRTVASNGVASGPVSFINVFQELASTIKQAGTRGLATLVTMPIYHPDIESFITAKYEEGKWENANISIGITHEFMNCVENNLDFNLSWKGEVRKTVKAKELWNKICTLAHRNGEPGILFLDTMNEDSPYNGYEHLDSTNPCTSGDSPINTSDGVVLAQNISKGHYIETVAGYEKVTTVESHKSVPVFKVIFGNGAKVTATAAHVFLGTHSSDLKVGAREIRLDELTTEHWVCKVAPSRKCEICTVQEAHDYRSSWDGWFADMTRVVSIESAGFSDVYDFYCEGSDTYVVNGIVSRGCGEVALPHNGACNLGSVIVSSFVDMKNKKIDYLGIENAAYDLTIWLDNLIDVSTFPTKAIEEVVKKYRPIGAGMMGLADLLLYMNIPYGNNPEATSIADELASVIEVGSLRASEDLAKQFGAFPAYDSNISKFPPRRNLTLTSYAPTGSISTLFDVSSGIESMFAPVLRRKEELGITITENSALKKYKEFHNITEIPDHARFSISGPEGTEISADDHVAILKTIIPYAQSGISKTIILAKDATVEDVNKVYFECWKARSKGVTVYRTGSRIEVPIESVDTNSNNSNLVTELEEVDIELVDMYRVPRKRPSGGLPATVYGLKFNPEQPTLWITITELDGEPFELFFSINNKTYQELLDFAGKSVTSSWRRAEWDIHLFEDFKTYESANGGSFYEYAKGKRVYIKSILHGISIVVLNHFKKMGLNNDDRVGIPTPMPEVDNTLLEWAEKHTKHRDKGVESETSEPIGEKCPECGEPTLIRSEGCNVCTNCGFSKCG